MSDNVTANSGTGGATFAADDIGGVHFPRTKLVIGADGSNDGDVAAGNPLPVTGTVAVTNAGLTELAAAINGSSQMDVNVAAGTVAVTNAGLTELAAAINASAQMDVNIAASGATVPVSNAGLTELAAAINASSQMDCNVAASALPSGAATSAKQDTEITALQLIDDTVFADDAGFTAGTSKVNVAGVYAVACGADPDTADANDAVAPVATRARQLFTIGGHPNVKSSVYNWTGTTTDDNIMATISGGTKYAITRITFTLDEACTVGVAVRLGFGTANVPALAAAGSDAVDDVLFYHPGMVPGTSYTVGDGSGILGVGGDGAELRLTAEATTGGTGGLVVTWFTLPS